MYLPEQCKIVEAIAPQVGAAITGDYISLKNGQSLWIMVAIAQGNAAPVAITIEKATAVDGTGATAITTAAKIWANEDTGASDALVRQTDAVNFTTSAALKNKLIIFQIDPVAHPDYDVFVVKTAASHADNLTSATYIMEARFPGATPPGGPSAIID